MAAALYPVTCAVTHYTCVLQGLQCRLYVLTLYQSCCNITCCCRRLVRAYNQSAATLNLLRGFSTGGYAGLDRIAQWNLDFMSNSDEGKAYMDLVGLALWGATGKGGGVYRAALSSFMRWGVQFLFAVHLVLISV